MQIQKELKYCGDFFRGWPSLLICPHIAVVYEHRYGFKFATLTTFFFSQPCTNDIRTFISSPPALVPNFATWLIWAMWGKEQKVSLGLCILQSVTSTPWPLDLPGQRLLCLLYQQPAVLISILGSSQALLYFPSCSQACRAEQHREIQVGLCQLWVSQVGAALCRCLPGPCCESSESCSVPPTSLLRQYLQPVLLVWLFSGCIWDGAEFWSIRKGHWGGGPDSLCVTLADFFLTVMTDELLI